MTPAAAEQLCDHGWRVGERTRGGVLACPQCRRALTEAVDVLVHIPAPAVDVASIAAGDRD